MAAVRRQKGDKIKETKNGNLVVTRANGTVVKINKNKGTITRTKPDGTVVKQKWTGYPTAPFKETGSAIGTKVRWNIEMPKIRKPSPSGTRTTRERGR
jgi:hypothetical protein